MDGGKEEIRRPRVRHMRRTERSGWRRMRLHPARRDSLNRGRHTVVAQGLPLRGVERVTGKALSKNAASRMWAEKSREQLQLLRNPPLTDAGWLAVLIDGVWLTRASCAWWWP